MAPNHVHWHLEERAIRHVYIRPRTPHLNGKVERSHRVDDQEFYQLLDKDGSHQLLDLGHNSTRARSLKRMRRIDRFQRQGSSGRDGRQHPQRRLHRGAAPQNERDAHDVSPEPDPSASIPLFRETAGKRLGAIWRRKQREQGPAIIAVPLALDPAIHHAADPAQPPGTIRNRRAARLWRDG